MSMLLKTDGNCCELSVASVWIHISGTGAEVQTMPSFSYANNVIVMQLLHQRLQNCIFHTVEEYEAFYDYEHFHCHDCEER